MDGNRINKHIIGMAHNANALTASQLSEMSAKRNTKIKRRKTFSLHLFSKTKPKTKAEEKAATTVIFD